MRCRRPACRCTRCMIQDREARHSRYIRVSLYLDTYFSRILYRMKPRLMRNCGPIFIIFYLFIHTLCNRCLPLDGQRQSATFIAYMMGKATRNYKQNKVVTYSSIIKSVSAIVNTEVFGYVMCNADEHFALDLVCHAIQKDWLPQDTETYFNLLEWKNIHITGHCSQ